MSRSEHESDYDRLVELISLMGLDLQEWQKSLLKDLYDSGRGQDMIIHRESECDTRPEVVPGGHPDGWDEYLTTLPSVSGTITIEAPPDVASAPILRHPITFEVPEVEQRIGEPYVGDSTPQARDESAGDTGRRELAEGKCQHAWRDWPHVSARPDEPNVYRQHRCGREAGHRGADECRYCGSGR